MYGNTGMGYWVREGQPNIPEPTGYFTLRKAHELIRENFSKLSDEKLHKKRIQLQDYIRFIELPDEYSRKTLIQGGYYAMVTDPYSTGMSPVDAFLYQNLRWALGEVDKETLRRKQEKEKTRIFGQPVVTRVSSSSEIKQQYTLKLQLAKSFDELQLIKNEITFLPLPQADKNQLIDIFNKRYSILTTQRPFGMPIPIKQREKPMILGAPTPQQQFEAEQRIKAEREKKARGQKTLTSAGSKKLFEFGVEERAQRHYRVQNRNSW
jgi:hypothetical protein